MKIMSPGTAGWVLSGGMALCMSGAVHADGTETLGTPSVAIASGTGVYANGTGMVNQPGVISVSVPAGATVKQVLLYWEGFMSDNVAGDNTVSVSNGGPASPVVGALIGGPTFFFSGAYASTFRADITSLGLIGAGVTNLTVSDMAYTHAANGAGVVVIFDDGSSDANIQVRDGSDLAFIGFAPPLQSTVPQTFTFPSSNADRTAQVSLFFASVAGTVSGGTIRPTAINLTTNGPGGGTTVLNNLLDSVSGEEWDSFTISVDISRQVDFADCAPVVGRQPRDRLAACFVRLAGCQLLARAGGAAGDCGRMTGGAACSRSATCALRAASRSTATCASRTTSKSTGRTTSFT